MHHTGIKTLHSLVLETVLYNFNCTIQELKRKIDVAIKYSKGYFNCTIQELKHMSWVIEKGSPEDFNCTIQELKPKMPDKTIIGGVYFNCTIQELKRSSAQAERAYKIFQLHHTGIKTKRAKR